VLFGASGRLKWAPHHFNTGRHHRTIVTTSIAAPNAPFASATPYSSYQLLHGILTIPFGVGCPLSATNGLNASLLITAHDGSQWIGTGWFISPAD
jgi:hypothetical protein